MSDLNDLERSILGLIPPSEHDIFGRNIPVGKYFTRIKLALGPNVSPEALLAALGSLIQKDFFIQLNKDFYWRTGKPILNLSE